eukprot:Hpha_TRINITY_DN7572_c0_g1::TRINITY_DN7572_c0_g1_i1::g.18847::m.18847
MPRLIPAVCVMQRAWRSYNAWCAHSARRLDLTQHKERLADEAKAWLSYRDTGWATGVLQRAWRCVMAKARCDKIRREVRKFRRAVLLREWNFNAIRIQRKYRAWHHWRTSTLAAALVMQAWYRLNHVRRAKRRQKAAMIITRAMRLGAQFCVMDRAARRIQFHWNLLLRRLYTRRVIRQWLLEQRMLEAAMGLKLNRALRVFGLRMRQNKARQDIVTGWIRATSALVMRAWSIAPPHVDDSTAAIVFSLHLKGAKKYWWSEKVERAELIKAERTARFAMRPKINRVPPRARAAMAELRRAARCSSDPSRPIVAAHTLDAVMCYVHQMQPTGDLPPRPPLYRRSAKGRPLWVAGRGVRSGTLQEGDYDYEVGDNTAAAPPPPPSQQSWELKAEPPKRPRPSTAPRQGRAPRMSPFTSNPVHAPCISPMKTEVAHPVGHTPQLEPVVYPAGPPRRPQSAGQRRSPVRGRPRPQSARVRITVPSPAGGAAPAPPPQPRPTSARPRRGAALRSPGAFAALSGWNPAIRPLHTRFACSPGQRLEARQDVSQTHQVFARFLRR